MKDSVAHRVAAVGPVGLAGIEAHTQLLTLLPGPSPDPLLVSGLVWADQKKGSSMGQKRHTPEQIIQKLRRAEVEIAQGATVPQVCKKIEVTKHTYCRWRTS